MLNMLMMMMIILPAIHDADVSTVQKIDAQLAQQTGILYTDLETAPELPAIDWSKLPQPIEQGELTCLPKQLNLTITNRLNQCDKLSFLCQLHINSLKHVYSVNTEEQLNHLAASCDNKIEAQSEVCSTFSSKVLWGTFFGFLIAAPIFLIAGMIVAK